MEIMGFILAIVMGFTLGLLGGGGSILTVPILVYVIGISPVLGTAYSLFVVGASAVVGAWRKHIEGLVAWKIGIVFAIPSLIAVFLTRYYLVPAVPEVLVSRSGIVITKNIGIMVFFGLVMVLAAYSMIRGQRKVHQLSRKTFNFPLIVLEGFVVGIITGIVGAGGGFLIVPALVLIVGLPIKTAIGTSLVIIAIKSLIGFLGDVGTGQPIDWQFLWFFTAFSIVGMLLGIYATRYIAAEKLKKTFGWFILIMGIFIIVKETVYTT